MRIGWEVMKYLEYVDFYTRQLLAYHDLQHYAKSFNGRGKKDHLIAIIIVPAVL